MKGSNRFQGDNTRPRCNYVSGSHDVERANHLKRAPKYKVPRDIIRIRKQELSKKLGETENDEPFLLLPKGQAIVLLETYLFPTHDIFDSFSTKKDFLTMALDLRDDVKNRGNPRHIGKYVSLYSSDGNTKEDVLGPSTSGERSTVGQRRDFSEITREIAKYRLVRLVQSAEPTFFNNGEFPLALPYLNRGNQVF